VPGVPVPVILGGAAVRNKHAFGPTIGSAVNVTLLTYVDTGAFGIGADTGAIPDFEVFHECLFAGSKVPALAGYLTAHQVGGLLRDRRPAHVFVPR